MDVLIYAFLIVTGAAGLSYYTLRRRFGRLLEEEQAKSFTFRNNELQLASEKQRLEAALKEKEQQIIETRAHILTEGTKSVSLSSEVLAKDKQIQSLTDQLQRETAQRTALQKELETVERNLAEVRAKADAGESKSSALSTDLTAKEQRIGSLNAELQHQVSLRIQTQEQLEAEQQQAQALKARLDEEERQRTSLAAELAAHTAALAAEQQERQSLSTRLAEEEARRTALETERAALSSSHAQREQQILSNHIRQSMELQEKHDALQREAEELRSADVRSQESIRALQHQLEQLQNELSATRGANESLNSARSALTEEYQRNEEELRRQTAEHALLLTVTSEELEKTKALLQEESTARQATEHALQESKQRLYAHIGELEQRLREQANAIAALQTQLTGATADADIAGRSIHAILRSVPIPVFVVNALGECEYCNAPLEELVGYGMTELSGKHFSRLFPEEERAFYEEQWKNTENRSEQFQGETRILAATNDAISAFVTFVDIHPNSESTRYVGFILDRTVEKDSQRHFAAAKEREQELQDLKSRFIGMVSNQLRTSLVTVATNTELLERFMDKWSDERRYHSFLRINESIRQMIDLVRDVTFTTRASAEQYRLTIGTVNIESVLQTSAKELAADLESQHRFILSEKGEIAAVQTDETLVRTIVHQLLSNAFKYSRDSTEVRAHVELADGLCTLRIEDQGIGIPAAEQKHLFSSFFRASNVANIYGTGLGLTIVQQCVNMLGGSVKIESELGRGTAVTVTIPAARQQ
ncbi:MAG: PAS domain-containing protein [Bacteroidetes bacterium]|nr:PAS domain-containing protein [Bacteroidota bacterium]